MKTLTMSITGMSCGGCVSNVRKALSDVSGVTIENVNVGSATVRYDPDVANEEAIRAAVTHAGYELAAA
jgi:copper chaperone